jgi:activator of 2-hydroxyglutaryl-CoA dehydratase
MGIRRDVAITGGVALKSGLVHIMEQEMGFDLLKPGQPQVVPALGAAGFASEISQGEEK